MFLFKSESMTFQNVLTWSITSAHSLNGSWLGLGLAFNHGSPTLCTMTLGNWNDLEQSFKLLLSQHHLYSVKQRLTRSYDCRLVIRERESEDIRDFGDYVRRNSSGVQNSSIDRVINNGCSEIIHMQAEHAAGSIANYGLNSIE